MNKINEKFLWAAVLVLFFGFLAHSARADRGGRGTITETAPPPVNNQPNVSAP